MESLAGVVRSLRAAWSRCETRRREFLEAKKVAAGRCSGKRGAFAGTPRARLLLRQALPN